MHWLVQRYFYFLHTIYHHPFHLSATGSNGTSSRIRFSLEKSTRMFLIWKCLYIFSIFYWITITSVFILNAEVYINQKDFVSLSLHTFWIGCTASLLINQGPYIIVGEDVVQLVNSNVDLISNLEHVHFGSGAYQRSDMIQDKLMAGLTTCFLSKLAFSCVPLFIIFREGMWLVGTYFYYLTLGIFPSRTVLAVTLGVMVDTWHLAGMQGSLALALYINMSFLFTFKTTVDHILSRKRKPVDKKKLVNKRRSRRLREFLEDLQIYSKLRILTTMYNKSFGTLYIPPVKTMLGMIIVQSVFITIRLTGKAKDMNGTLILFGFGSTCVLIGTGILFMLTTFTAMVHTYSTKLWRNLKGRVTARRKYTGRLLASFKVEAVKSWNFYEIRKVTCLTVLEILMNVTTSALLSFSV